MHDTIFDTEKEFASFLNKYLGKIQNISVESNSLLETELKAETKALIEQVQRPGTVAMLVPKFNYIIKNDDLPLLESLFDGLKTVAGVNFFMESSTDERSKIIAACIGVFMGLFKLGKNIKNKGIIVPAPDMCILVCLKSCSGGADINYIHHLLNKNSIDITPELLENRLQALGTVYSIDGSKKELVIKENDLYRTSGI